MNSKFRMKKLPAVVGTPNAARDRLRIYTVEAPADVVAHFESERALDVEGGFQRPLDTARARKIGILLSGDEKKDRDPEPHVHGGLLCYTLEDDEVSYSPSTKVLTIRKPLHFIDGQTRGAGSVYAIEQGKVKDYTENLRIVVGSTLVERVRWYLIANMQARKSPPQNVLLNVATLSGTQQNRKSWIARVMATASTQAPFTLQKRGEEIKRLVSFDRKDGGKISAYSLYKAINFMLPDDLNKEGESTEDKAYKAALVAFKMYADIYSDVWGETDEDGKLKDQDCYGFTLMSAFGQFYKAVLSSGVEKPADVIRNTWAKAGFDKGLPEGSGSGERAAKSLAMYAQGEAGIRLHAVA